MMDGITNWFMLCFEASELAYREKSRNDQIKMRGGLSYTGLETSWQTLANL